GLRRPAPAAATLAACPLSVSTATLSVRPRAIRRRRRGDRRTGPRRAAGRAANPRAVAQAVDAVDHHLLADLETLGDGDFLAVGRAGLDDANADRVIGLREIDEGARLAALDRRDRHG